MKNTDEMTVVEKINELIENTEDLSAISFGMSEEDIDSVESVFDYINNAIDEQIEYIYYSDALKFLEENDPSLQEALCYAEEYGFEPSKLSSTILATLDAQRWAEEDFENIKDEIEEIVNEYLESK